jgi:hypothetical protein
MRGQRTILQKLKDMFFALWRHRVIWGWCCQCMRCSPSCFLYLGVHEVNTTWLELHKYSYFGQISQLFPHCRQIATSIYFPCTRPYLLLQSNFARCLGKGAIELLAKSNSTHSSLFRWELTNINLLLRAISLYPRFLPHPSIISYLEANSICWVCPRRLIFVCSHSKAMILATNHTTSNIYVPKALTPSKHEYPLYHCKPYKWQQQHEGDVSRQPTADFTTSKSSHIHSVPAPWSSSSSSLTGPFFEPSPHAWRFLPSPGRKSRFLLDAGQMVPNILFAQWVVRTLVAIAVARASHQGH